MRSSNSSIPAVTKLQRLAVLGRGESAYLKNAGNRRARRAARNLELFADLDAATDAVRNFRPVTERDFS